MNADGSETELLDLEEYCGDDLHEIEKMVTVFKIQFT